MFCVGVGIEFLDSGSICMNTFCISTDITSGACQYSKWTECDDFILIALKIMRKL